MSFLTRRMTLTGRLTCVFTLLLVLFAAGLLGLQRYSNERYTRAMVQELSAGLAAHIADSYPLLSSQGLNQNSVRSLFDHLMAVNPSVEVYLLDKTGRIIGDAAPQGRIQRRQVDINPITEFLTRPHYPLYGDDPRSPGGRKVFSAAPLRYQGQLQGYLYVILLGEDYARLRSGAEQGSLLTLASGATLLAVVLLGGLAVLAFSWVTRPLRRLSARVRTLENGGLAGMQAVAAQRPPDAGSADEIQQLQRGVISMAEQIAAQWESLARQEQQRREFIANVSHDLRTPLTALHGYLETLLVMSGSLSEQEKRHYLETALAQSRKVGGLAQSLFELARLEYGVVKPLKERFSLPELVQDVFQKMALTAQAREQQLELDIAPNLPMIEADLGMIERVITNLIDNALRHTPEQGSVGVRLWQEAGRVMVRVSDTGPGVPEALKATLFLRPSLLNHQRLTSGGLGLMIVRQMLQLHGSDIRLREGPGASFEFGFQV